MSYQIIILEGRLTKDPEMHTYGDEGHSLASFTVAVDNRPDKNGEKSAEFFSCKAFRKSAEFIGEYFHKGDAILVQGKIKTESWEDRETGAKKYRTTVIVDNATFTVQAPRNRDEDDGDREERAPVRASKPAAKPAGKPAGKPARQQPQQDESEFDSDIPF